MTVHAIEGGKRKTVKPAGEFLDALSSKVKRKKFGTVDIESKHGCDFDLAKGTGCPECEDIGPDHYVGKDAKPIPCPIGQKPGFTRPFLVGFYDREKGRYQSFRDEPHLATRRWDRRASAPGGCIDKLMTVILAKKYSGYAFYAHNGGDFDFLHLLAWLRNHRDEFDFEIVPIQTTIQVLHVWRVPENPDKPITERWEFLDSIKLFPMSLQRACEAFGVEGKIADHDLAEHEEHPSWDVYLKQDCVALADVVNRFHDMVEDWGGEVGITTPSTSMRLFRRRFLGRGGVQEKVPRYRHFPDCGKPVTCESCLHEFVRRGYYGGRTEIHAFMGDGLKYADINSSYVAAMLRDMPIGDLLIEEGGLDWRRHETGRWTGFCECTVYIPPECTIPPLPHRHRETKKLVFPAGQFHGVWSVEELALLKHPLVNGEIRHVVKTVWYGLRPLFGEMVKSLWKYRDKSDPNWDKGLDQLAKLLGNALYGKFAMKPDRQSVVFRRIVGQEHCFLCGEEKDDPRRDICDGCYGSKPAMHEEDSDVWYQAKRTDAAYIIPQISAHITALARITLWHKMAEVVANGGKLYYLDTDSIVSDYEIETSSELGEMKDEYPGERLGFLAVQPKVYLIRRDSANAELADKKRKLEVVGNLVEADKVTAHKHKVTMKGFPQRLKTPENLELLRAGGKVTIDRLEKVRTLARTGFKRGPRMVRVAKGFRSRYDKRIVCANGNDTVPIVLDEPIGGVVEEVDQAAEE